MKVLVLGAGQLARMMALASTPLNIDVLAYDVNNNSVVNPLAPGASLGDLTQGIAECDVITAEFEHIEHAILEQCQRSGKLQPSATAIMTGGDRRLEKALLTECSVSNAKHVIVDNQQSFEQALSELSLPIIFKSALAGYDGKGQWRLKDCAQAQALWSELSEFLAENPTQALVAEQMVAFDREISIIGARNQNGEVKIYPLTENFHQNGVLSVSLAQASDEALQQQALSAFTKLTENLGYTGVLAIEFFQVGEQLLVNEIAPRVHNSGHWSQQGADTCQFENHIRAVTNLPLGNTELVRPTAMINILGTDTVPDALLAIAGLSIHWYGKTKRAGRKMGHINVSAADCETLISKLEQVASLLPETDFPGVKSYIQSL